MLTATIGNQWVQNAANACQGGSGVWTDMETLVLNTYDPIPDGKTGTWKKRNNRRTSAGRLSCRDDSDEDERSPSQCDIYCSACMRQSTNHTINEP